jgi:septum formation protein
MVWLYHEPLLLASKSQARQKILSCYGIDFETCPASIDERQIEKKFQIKNHQELAVVLARAKAESVHHENENRCVLGADQILVCKDQRFHQCKTRDQGISHLKRLSGEIHSLISAAVFIGHEKRQHIWIEQATMHMRDLTLQEIENYFETEGNEVLNSVGCYHFESTGHTLFVKTSGTKECILGLPMEGFVSHLVKQGYLER